MDEKNKDTKPALYVVIGVLITMVVFLAGGRLQEINIFGVAKFEFPTKTPISTMDTPFAQPTNLVIPTNTNSQSVVSSAQFTENDIDAVIGKGHWRCIDGSPKSISIDQVPYNYVVSFPFTRIDTDGNFYKVNERVSGGGLGTGWLVSDLPNFSCSYTKPQVNFEIINRLLESGKWKCAGESQPSGVDLFVVPSNFTVQSPIIFVDSEGKRYYQGDEIPARKFARVWFGNDIPQNECP